MTNHEVFHRIQQAAEVFHDRAGFCDVYNPDTYKQHIGRIEKAIRLSFQELQLPRSTQALLESQLNIVPQGGVRHTNDDETADGNISSNI